MNKNVILLLLCFGLGGSHWGRAQSVALSLEEAIAMAMKKNQTLEAKNLDKEINRYKQQELNSAFFPTVFGSAGINHYMDLPQSFLPASTFDPSAPSGAVVGLALGLPNASQAGIKADWLIYNQSVFTGHKLLANQIDLTTLQIKKEERDVAYTVSQLYYGISFTQLQMDILEDNLNAVKALLKNVRSNYKNGFVKPTDVDRVLVNQVNLESQMGNLANAIANQKRILKVMIGMDGDAELTLSQSFENDDLKEVLDNSASFENTLDYKIVEKQVELSTLNLTIARNKFLPTVALTYSLSENWVSQDFGDLLGSDLHYTQQYLGLNLSVPIFSGFDKKSKVNQSKIQTRQLALNQQFLENKLEAEIANARDSYNQNVVASRTRQTNVSLAKRVYEQSMIEYREGVVTLNDVLNAEISMREAQSQYLSAISQSLIGLLDYKKASGQLLNTK